jgi:hypothetical protein
MSQELLEMIPEFDEIKDTELRRQSMAVWQEAMAYRGWTAAEIAAIPFTLLADDVKITFLEHVRTVCKMCIACDQILTEAYGPRKTPVNRDHLVAGALLADVGKLFEYDKQDGKVVKSRHGTFLRHPFTSVGLGFKHGMPEEVLHLAAVHSKEGEGFKRSPEAIILHHADFIDFELVK